jgi:signal transduction histidine kinase
LRRAPIRIRAFILGTVLVVLLVPTLAAGAAWVVEGNRQQADIRQRLNAAVDYLASHPTEMREPTAVQGFVGLLGRLDLLAQVTLVTKSPPDKHPVYTSPVLDQVKGPPPRRLLGPGKTATAAPALASWVHDRERLVPAGTRGAPATLVTDLYHRPASRTTQALVALVTGVLVLLVGLAVAVWLAGRWMVAPLTTLSAQVDKVAGGDLAIAVPRSRIDEIANIAQAVEGMTAALGETAQRRTEADEARRFLVTGIAHDLRTPLFALRGHLQAIRSRLGDPALHLERAEARADALERLTGNLFAYTRDDYTQPALQLEAIPVADLLDEVTASLEHSAHLRGSTFELEGDGSVAVVVDRERARRALANILDNAIRYSPRDAPVDLSWAADDDFTVGITIRDHGPGIDPDVLPRIFEPGARGAPADGSADGGAGLGLTIAKRLLEQQHATLTVQNQPAGGAETKLTLRRAPSTERS